MGCLSVSWLPVQPSVSLNGRNGGGERRGNRAMKGKMNKNINTKIRGCAGGAAWGKCIFALGKCFLAYTSIGNYATTYCVLKHHPKYKRIGNTCETRAKCNPGDDRTPSMIYWFLLLIFGESRQQERCQKIGKWAHGMTLFTHNLVIN